MTKAADPTPTDDTTAPPIVAPPTTDPSDPITERSVALPGDKDRTAPEPPSATDAGVPHVEDATPDDLDEDPASSVVTPNDSEYQINTPATMQEQKTPRTTGAAEQRGYYGETAADRAKAAKVQQDAALTVSSNAEAVANVNPTEQEN